MRGFRPLRWLAIAVASAVLMATPNSARAQFRAASGDTGRGKAAGVATPRGPPAIARPNAPREPGRRFAHGGRVQPAGAVSIGSDASGVRTTDKPAPFARSRRRGQSLPARERRYVPDEVLVEVASRPSQDMLDALAARHRLTALESHVVAITDTIWFRWRIADDRPVAIVVRSIEAEGWIRSVQPNYRFRLQATGADPAR